MRGPVQPLLVLRNQQPPVLSFLTVCRAVENPKSEFWSISKGPRTDHLSIPAINARVLWRIWQAPCPPGKEDRYRNGHIIIIQWVKRCRRKVGDDRCPEKIKSILEAIKHDLTELSSGGFTNFQFFHQGNVYPRAFIADKREFWYCFASLFSFYRIIPSFLESYPSSPLLICLASFKWPRMCSSNFFPGTFQIKPEREWYTFCGDKVIE